ncbi:MAG: hypothetical protein K1X51_00085 [Rhodospirillaceae bacterium]|nr:hypothetical protein [Rhodospirillaceae bacterium]
MSLAQILNLSRPRLAVGVLVGSVAVVAFSLHSLRYHPKVFDACAGVASVTTPENAAFERAAEIYLRQTRNWSLGDYCIDKNARAGDEHRVSVFRRGMLVGGGEGFRIRIDPATMTVKGELAHE